MEDRRLEKSKTIILWLVAFLCIAVFSAIGIGIGWAVSHAKQKAQETIYHRSLDNVSRQSYYRLSEEISKMIASMNKLTVSNTPSMQKSLLDDVVASSAGAEAAVAVVMPETVNGEKTLKFINQVGDYCAYLQDKLEKGNAISKEEKENLQALYEVALKFEASLSDLNAQTETEDFSFIDKIGISISENMFTQLENTLISYPSLIYDGPFSDSLEEASPKALNGEEIDEEKGKSLVSKYLSHLSPTNISYMGEATNGFVTLMYSAETTEGTAYVDITKQGGMLSDFNIAKEVDDPLYEEESCIYTAKEYLKEMGYQNMTEVWVSNYNSVFYINFTYTIEDTVIYPDMVVVKVASDSNKVIGIEALNYIYNHQERQIQTPTITEEEARINLSTDIKVENIRLALIPRDGGKELLTYEIYGVKGEDKYFVYMDALTGSEINILRVIDSDKGMLLE